jgi:hypothetical protein
VKRLLPELIADYRNRWRELRQQFRQWRSGERGEAGSVVRRSGVAAAVATIREATMVALVVAAIGLLCVGLALVLRENPAEKVGLRVTIEYYAALLFFLAVSVTHNGVWGERQNRELVPHDDWLRRSVKVTARAYGLAILCAWVLGTIGAPWATSWRRSPMSSCGAALACSSSPAYRTRWRRRSDGTADAEVDSRDPVQLPDRRGLHQGPLRRPLRLLRPSVPGGHAHWPGARGRLVLRTLHPLVLPEHGLR